MTDAAVAEAHPFDRRIDDANVADVADRLTKVESGLREIALDTKANTEAVTKMQERVNDMIAIMDAAETFFRAVAKTASGLGKASDGVSRFIKRFWWLLILASACVTYFKTGKFPDLPLWPQ